MKEVSTRMQIQSTQRMMHVTHQSRQHTADSNRKPSFLYLVDCQGCKELSQSLKMIHDLALYHSDIPFDIAEKTALFDLKVLWEGLEKMGAKA
jgi:hypothetical protein